MSYAELHALSAFSFQRGASMPQELMQRAAQLDYAALALTDECSLAGVVRAWEQGRQLQALGQHAPALIVGSELRLEEGLRCVLLAQTQAGYSALCATISAARRRAIKGRYHLTRADFDTPRPDLCVLWLPRGEQELEELAWLRERYANRLWIAVELHRQGRDREQLARLQELGRRFAVPLLASGDVHMHVRRRRALQDVMTALRLHQPVSRCGHALFANGERHLRKLEVLRELYPAELLRETLVVAERCAFRIDQVRYQYPRETVAPGHTPASWLRALVQQHLPERWPQGCPEKVRATLDKELAIIAEKNYEPFFLTVYDIVRFARKQQILCQGRGSAANSAVCYVLGITEVNPEHHQLLFERFVSRERDEAPDIDVDFEHERREEVIQYVYRKYGRERAALAASVISYQPRSALRDVGRALEIGPEIIDRVAQSLAWWDDPERLAERLQVLGIDAQAPRIRRWLQLSGELIAQSFPRHLSQHVGGFVISDQPLHELVPVENAAMAGRTVIQWDKDDLEALGLLKVDVLALGMLTAMRRTLQHLHDYDGRARSLSEIPPQDAQTYQMLQRAESVGVFQVESRAQMSMLPRLKPANLYDLTVQVAIVRPGPIQGGMVHPYLRRRLGEEPITYPKGARDPLRSVLERTCGVPIFQEQVMQIAMVAADFSADQADALRRAMAAWKRAGGIERFRDKLMRGLLRNGYSAEFAAQIFRQIEGFGSYGFPESHAASFALLAYQSAYLKRHHPAAFICGLINAQPMGFYPPSMLIREAQRLGVTVHGIDVCHSHWDCHLQGRSPQAPALRLGLRLVKGFNEAAAQRIAAARAQGFADVETLAQRAQLSSRELEALAAADALRALSGHRHQARWQAHGRAKFEGLLREASLPDEAVALPAPSEGEDILADYRSTSLTLRRHPVALLRERLDALHITANAALEQLADGAPVRVAGVVMFRQRPGSAQGTMFLTLEDDTGIVNLIVRPELIEREREAIIGAQFLLVRGRLQRQHQVTHVIATQFIDRSSWIAGLPYLSRDFR